MQDGAGKEPYPTNAAILGCLEIASEIVRIRVASYTKRNKHYM